MPEVPEEQSASGAGWDVYAVAFSDAPHDRWREIRTSSPVLDVGDGVFLVTSFSLVDEVVRDARHRAGEGVSASFGASEGLGFDVMRVWLMSLDGEAQTRARGLVRRSFTPKRIEALRPLVEDTADGLVRRIEEADEGEIVDLVDALAFPLPSEVIRSLFGLPRDAWQQEVEAILQAVDDRPTAGLEMIEALAQSFQRRLERGDVPTGLLAQLQDPDAELGRLSPLEIVANAVLLVTAAIDTTAGLIGNAAHCLLERPETLERVRRDADLVGPAIEETLRFEPPALSCSRRTVEPVTLGGVEIPVGSQLLLGLAAAGRDPARYTDPDRFDLDRDLTGLLSFGGGRHFCLGAALARLEAQIAIERLLVSGRRSLELVEPPRWQRRNPTIRALERLPVRVGPERRPS